MSSVSLDDQIALAVLESRLKCILPEEYQDSYEDLQPVSMGSAGLKYEANGQVAWDQMWATFCDLAMAGGPPHKGTLLQPASAEEIAADQGRYDAVVEEICRGITLASDLPAKPSPVPGWVRVDSYSEGMAAWLLRAIVMENVAVRAEGRALDLPAAPGFRIEKEIKNVITVIAKTSHYWMGHMPRTQRTAINDLFATMAVDAPLVQPSLSPARVPAGMAAALEREIGVRAVDDRYPGWLGLECPSVKAAIWIMRGLVVSNVLSRREGTVLFVPIDPAKDPHGEVVVTRVVRTWKLARVKGALG